MFACVKNAAIFHQPQTTAEPSGFEAHWRRLYLENNALSDTPILTCQLETRLLLVIFLIKINQGIKSSGDPGKNSIGWSPEPILPVQIWHWLDMAHLGFNSNWPGIMAIEGHKFSLVQIEIVHQVMGPINSNLGCSQIIHANTFLRTLLAPKTG